MKIVIWLLCVALYSAVTVLIGGAGVSLGGIPTVLLAVVLVFLPAPFFCKLWDKRKKAEQAETTEPVCDRPTPATHEDPARKDPKPKRSLWLRIACVAMALCIVGLSIGLIVCIDEYNSLEYAHQRLEDKLEQIEQDAEWDTDLEGRRQAMIGLEKALWRFFYSYEDNAWEELADLLEQFS